jgi:small-conductance mechanosensitive channel
MSQIPSGFTWTDLWKTLRWVAVGVTLIAVGAVMKLTECTPIGKTCLRDIIFYLGLVIASNCTLCYLLKIICVTIYHVPYLMINIVFSTMVLHSQIALLFSSIVVYSLWRTTVNSDTVFNELLLFYIALQAVRLLQKAVLLQISNEYIWSANANTIMNTVRVQQVFKVLTDYTEDHEPVFDTIDGNDLGNRTLYAVYKAIERSQATVDAERGGQLFDRLLNNLQDETRRSTGRTSPKMQRIMKRVTTPRGGRNKQQSPRPIVSVEEGAVLPMLKLLSLLPADLKVTLKSILSEETIEKFVFQKAFNDAQITREHLWKTLKDYAAIVQKLNGALTCVSALVLALLAMIIAHIPFIGVGTFAVSVFLGLSIVFGTTARKFFEGIMLVAVVKPFVIGDSIIILDDARVENTYTVQGINLLTTELMRTDGQLCIFNNSILQDREIRNESRAKCPTTSFTIRLQASTPSAICEQISTTLEKKRLKDWSNTVKSVKVYMISTQDDTANAALMIEISFSGSASTRPTVRESFIRETHDFFTIQSNNKVEEVKSEAVNEEEDIVPEEVKLVNAPRRLRRHDAATNLLNMGNFESLNVLAGTG